MRASRGGGDGRCGDGSDDCNSWGSAESISTFRSRCVSIIASIISVFTRCELDAATCLESGAVACDLSHFDGSRRGALAVSDFSRDRR
jgi:hypothetical protein